MEDVWDKLHSLESDLSYLMDERDSKPETVNSKHAWDMILLHIIREIGDAKIMIAKIMSD